MCVSIHAHVPVYACACLCICTYVCLLVCMHLSLCVCVCVPAVVVQMQRSEGHLSCPASSLPYFETCFLVCSMVYTRLTVPQLLGLFRSQAHLPIETIGSQVLRSPVQLLSGLWGFKLMSSGMESKLFYSLNHFPSSQSLF